MHNTNNKTDNKADSKAKNKDDDTVATVNKENDLSGQSQLGDTIHNLRESYEKGELSEDSVCASPFKQFEAWFAEAQSAQLAEPNAMVVATVDENNCPNTRTVLLKKFDDKGFVFFTNYGSQKAQEMAQNPNVTLQFLWLDLERQVKIRGTAEKISTQESMSYFFSRPKGSQLGAWVSEQSKVVSSRAVLMNQFAKLKQQFKEGDIEFPKFWGGYRVIPSYFEYWQGGKDRIHDRIIYQPLDQSQSDSDWQIKRLAP